MGLLPNKFSATGAAQRELELGPGRAPKKEEPASLEDLLGDFNQARDETGIGSDPRGIGNRVQSAGERFGSFGTPQVGQGQFLGDLQGAIAGLQASARGENLSATHAGDRLSNQGIAAALAGGQTGRGGPLSARLAQQGASKAVSSRVGNVAEQAAQERLGAQQALGNLTLGAQGQDIQRLLGQAGIDISSEKLRQSGLLGALGLEQAGQQGQQGDLLKLLALLQSGQLGREGLGIQREGLPSGFEKFLGTVGPLAAAAL